MGVVTFLALTMATKIVSGTEALVYYHHEVAVLTISGALLAALGQPVLPYLDVTALGLGVFLACGRCGCLMVGCCHGKPHLHGVRYGDAHAAEGFPSCYVGTPLFPVQALESLLVALIVCGGSLLVMYRWPAGAALTWYVVSYSAARIGLEELRGDRVRPYWLRLSEAQWTSLLLITAVVIGEWQGRLPMSWWHVAMCIGAAVALVALAAGRTDRSVILHPRHASEIADILKAPDVPGWPIAVRRTSLNVGLSKELLDGANAMLYSMSRADRHLTVLEAHALARFISLLASPPGNSGTLVHGRRDVFHLIIHEALD
jgi:hypothetical protein